MPLARHSGSVLVLVMVVMGMVLVLESMRGATVGELAVVPYATELSRDVRTPIAVTHSLLGILTELCRSGPRPVQLSRRRHSAETGVPS